MSLDLDFAYVPNERTQINEVLGAGSIRIVAPRIDFSERRQLVFIISKSVY
jgi:hypothetical protein